MGAESPGHGLPVFLPLPAISTLASQINDVGEPGAVCARARLGGARGLIDKFSGIL